jgi:predicted nucleic acid-binding protein
VIYLDSCIVIYAVEDDGPRGNAVRQRLTESADAVVAVSPLVTLECLVGPLRDENYGLHDHYLRALHNFKPLPLETEHYVRAAELRARYGLKTPDALHLAAAQMHGCDELWTNDNRLAAAAKNLVLNVTATSRES